MTDAAKAISDVLEYFETGKKAEWMKKKNPGLIDHGKVVERRCEPFYDVTVYEDGYESRFYVGD